MGLVYIVGDVNNPYLKGNAAAYREADGWRYTEEELREMEQNPCPNSVAVRSLASNLPPRLGREKFRTREPRSAFNNNMVVPGDLRRRKEVGK